MSDVRIFVRHIPEEVVPGKRLGRHVRLDSRSAAYPFRTRSQLVGLKLWARNIPILDQGNLGSCTGNAEVGALATGPVWDDLPIDHPLLNEAFAVKLYSSATQLDDYPGAYPPNDTGSDGISVSKAAQKLGLISGYTHCTDIGSMEAALQVGPVIVGVNWYSSFDTPDSSGLVTISRSAYVRGGHEFLVRGVDPGKREFYADNSWGEGWGLKGSFRFSYATMNLLLGEQGDCTVPVPATVPAPTPAPTPTPADANDKALWAATGTWAGTPHIFANSRTVASALETWAHEKGLT